MRLRLLSRGILNPNNAAARVPLVPVPPVFVRLRREGIRVRRQSLILKVNLRY